MIGTDIDHAAELLRSGTPVAFPTETVYGLGADATSDAAVAKVFALKNRPRFDPLIVHIAEGVPLERIVRDIPETARRLMAEFWPGPLTLVLPKTDRISDLVTSGLPTVAVRCPDHELAQELLRLCGRPVAAPSANPFGAISPTTAEHVESGFGEAAPYVLDGGPCRIGVESTVVIPGDSGVDLLREGGTSREQIEAVVRSVRAGTAVLDEKTIADGATEQPAGPGMLARHYSPRTPLYLVDYPAPSMSQRVGLLTFRPLESCHPFAAVEVLSEAGDPTEAASNLFAALHRLDRQPLDCILATPCPDEGLGRAINDRLRRAARE